MPASMQPLAYSVPEVLATLGICRDKLYKLIKSKQLPASKLGTRTLIFSRATSTRSWRRYRASVMTARLRLAGLRRRRDGCGDECRTQTAVVRPLDRSAQPRRQERQGPHPRIVAVRRLRREHRAGFLNPERSGTSLRLSRRGRYYSDDQEGYTVTPEVWKATGLEDGAVACVSAVSKGASGGA